ncbi:MAG: hypothetical protein R3B09_04615 [Nannocystaceae bacterium]
MRAHLGPCAALLLACAAPATPEPPVVPSSVVVASDPEPASSEDEPAPPIAEIARPRAPTAADPSGRGDACEDDAGCGWDHACLPQRCVGAASAAPEAAACDESGPPPGACVCVTGRCMTRPDPPPPPSDEGCHIEGCGLDEGAGRCVVGRMFEANRYARDVGPLCTCDAASRRCGFEWLGPIACTTVEQCWVSRTSPWHPIPRPKALRGRKFSPCRDGELAPACKDGRCTLLAYSC